MVEHDDRGGVGHVVVGTEAPAEQRGHAEGFEERRGDAGVEEPLRGSPSPSSTLLQLDEPMAAVWLKPRIPADQSWKLRYENSLTPWSGDDPAPHATTSRSGCRMGRGRSRTAWTTLKMALVAAMVRARVRVAEAE